MIGNYPVVTLCGSTRFKDEFLEVQKKLTLQGNIVISVGLFSHSDGQENINEDTLKMLIDIHKRKIDMSDSIYVINVGGYIGNTTKSEIEYAKNHSKEVRYLEEIKGSNKDTDKGNDCNSCKYQKEVDGSNCYECVKGMRNNYTADLEKEE